MPGKCKKEATKTAFFAASFLLFEGGAVKAEEVGPARFPSRCRAHHDAPGKTSPERQKCWANPRHGNDADSPIGFLAGKGNMLLRRDLIRRFAPPSPCAGKASGRREPRPLQGPMPGQAVSGSRDRRAWVYLPRQGLRPRGPGPFSLPS